MENQNTVNIIAPKSEEKIEEKKQKDVKDDDSSGSEEEKQTPEEKALWDKIDEVLKQYHLTAF